MDTALKLRLLKEKNLLKNQTHIEVMRLLTDSKLIEKLTSIEHKNLLFYLELNRNSRNTEFNLPRSHTKLNALY